MLRQFVFPVALVAVVLLVAPTLRAQTPFPPPTPNPNPGVIPSASGQGIPSTLGYTTTTQLTTVARAAKGPLQVTIGGGPVATFLARRHVFTISHQAFVPIVTPTIQTVQYQAVQQPVVQYVIPVQVQVPTQQSYQSPPPPAKGTPQAAFQYQPVFANPPTATQPVYLQAVPGNPGMFRLCNPPTTSSDEVPPPQIEPNQMAVK